MKPSHTTPSTVFNMAVILLLSLLAGAIAQGHGQYSPWKAGRATHFGLSSDGWSIHSGHCMYGKLNPNDCTGYNIAALSDQMDLYKKYESTAACGICIEVKCKNMNFKDGNGENLERSDVCYDPNASIVVQVVDRCLCKYADNVESNKRWCCGDMPHMDLSVYTMAQLADIGKGVIGIEYRQVPCTYTPVKSAAGNFKNGVPDLKTDSQDWGKQQPRPCDGGIPNSQKMSGFSVFRPALKHAVSPGKGKKGSDKTTKGVKKGGKMKCKIVVGGGQQCGGLYKDKQAGKGLRDAQWAGVCCKAGLKCKRFNKGWWGCSK